MTQPASDRLLVAQAEARSLLMSSPEPAYPLLAGATGVRGPVLAEVEVSGEGRVTAVRIVQGSPLLESAAVDAVQQWRFSPLERDGRPIAYRTSMLVTFAGRRSMSMWPRA
jgi:protein TonB